MLLAEIILITLGLAMAALSLYQAWKGTVEPLSLRNVMFVSFGVFQISSGLIAIVNQDWGQYPLTNPNGTSITFALLGAAFVLLFQLSYHVGPVAKKLAWKVPGENATPNAAGLLILALAMLGTGMAFKQVLVYVPVFGPLADLIGGGLLALAAGLATWAWAPRLLNPVVAAYAGGLILVCMLISVIGNYGRRDLVSVMATCAWAMYHGWWKHFGFGYAMRRFAVFGGAGLVLLAAWTTVRGTKTSAADVVQAFQNAKIRQGLYDLASGQLSANISMWLIETRPNAYEYETLHSLGYGAVMPVPRVIYPNKPRALGMRIPKQAKLEGKPDGFNVGPGMVGHIVNDNPWLALWIYPLLLGAAFRFGDEAIRARPYSPFIALPVAAGLGELTGIARGELGLFTFNAMAAMVTAYFAMIAVRVVLAWFGWRPAYDTGEEDWFDEVNPFGHGDEPYEDYGEDAA